MVDGWGFGSLKLKGGVLPPEEECEAIEALREAFPSMPLRLDPNGAWTPETSLKVASRLAGVVEYLEDPTPGIPGMARSRRAPTCRWRPTCASSRWSTCRPRSRRTPSRSCSPTTTSGAGCEVGAARRDHRGLGLGLSMHSNSHLGVSLAAMVHLAAATPNLTYACDTHYPWKTPDVVADGVLSFVDGSVAVPDGSGARASARPRQARRAARALPLLRRTPARGHRLHALHPAGLRGQHLPLVTRSSCARGGSRHGAAHSTFISVLTYISHD